MFDGQLFTVEFQASHLDFISGSVAVRIFVENSKGGVSIIWSGEEPSDVFDNKIV